MKSQRVKRRRSAAETVAAEAIAENDDLLMEIIVHLPAKSLVRFKSVSKHWRSLISDPFFTNRHTCLMSRKPTPPSFMFCSHSRFFYFNHISKSFCTYNFNSPYTKILHSSHGLMLLRFENNKNSSKEYCVYNPTTRQSRLLMLDESTKFRSDFEPMVYLIFDPSRSLHYKVVFVRMVYHSVWKFVLRVYNSKSNKFKRKVVAFTCYLREEEGIYWNSRVHWFRPGFQSYGFQSYGFQSYYLDFRKWCFRRGPFLKIPWGGSQNYIEFNGHLYCVCMYLWPKKKYMLVFKLLEELGWIKMSRVDMNPILDLSSSVDLGILDLSSSVGLGISGAYRYAYFNPKFGVLGIVGADRDEDVSILLRVWDKIVLYRFCDNKFEVVLDGSSNSVLTDSKFQFQRNNAYQFIESLAPV